MTFLAKLFGGGSKASPVAPPPPPQIGDAAGEAAARAARYRARKNKGTEDSILAKGLGDIGTGAGLSSPPVRPMRSTLG